MAIVSKTPKLHLKTDYIIFFSTQGQDPKIWGERAGQVTATGADVQSIELVKDGRSDEIVLHAHVKQSYSQVGQIRHSFVSIMSLIPLPSFG